MKTLVMRRFGEVYLGLSYYTIIHHANVNSSANTIHKANKGGLGLITLHIQRL